MMHFKFSENLSYAQIQLFAKTVKSMMRDEFSFKNEDLLNITLPEEFDSLHKLCDLCLENGSDEKFHISTPNHPDMEYGVECARQISNLDVSLYLSILQRSFNEFKYNNNTTLELADSLLTAFICINNGISNYFFLKASDNGTFSWEEKYKPCYFNLDKLRQFRSQIALCETKYVEKKELLKDSTKGIIMNFTYQCGFLCFWRCLLDVVTCPCCTDEEKEVLGNLAQYILKNYSNIHIYNIVVEADDVHNGDYVWQRGSVDNTTRVKLYFTDIDDHPILLRLDLPHIDCPYVHINIESEHKNTHVPLSKETDDGRYDHVFEELRDALLQYNFNATDYYHSPCAKDKEIMQDMCYRTAILDYSICAYYYALIGNASKICYAPEIIYARSKLEELLKCDSIKEEELKNLNPIDILELAMSEIYND